VAIAVLMAAPAGAGGICPGDIDGDGQVGVTDFLQLIADWGTSGTDADINEDGIVDVLDFLDLLNNWGACP
jgi:hypothetical protein